MSARPVMKSQYGPDPILERVRIEGRLEGTLALLKYRQDFRNRSVENIEIVYTFPEPRHSTILDLTVEVAGQRRKGQVLLKDLAEARYEKGIADGDTAIMVERPEPGLYVMNLGNLQAGESAAVEIELAMLLDWRHNRLRLSLPMTLAPRYGEEHSALAPHQKPRSNILVERPFEMALTLSKAFDGATIGSPTHAVRMSHKAGESEVRLHRDSAWMDRDFVLTVDGLKVPGTFVHADSAGGTVVYGSFQVPSSEAERRARDIKVVLDCSGSMAGDSIALARKGMLDLLDSLRPADRFGLVAFGSHAVMWKPSLVVADEDAIEAASAWTRDRNADMGGTELEAALRSAFRMEGSGKACDVFLLTDGQAADTRHIAEVAKRAGHRVFIVGIGTAPQQDALERLAHATGGAIEWAAPGEGIADAVHALFSRMVEVPVSDLSFRSAHGVGWEVRAPDRHPFSGDMVHYFAQLTEGAQPVTASWRLPDGTRHQAQLEGAACDARLAKALPRIAAAARIEALERKGKHADAAKLAVEHQLITRNTNYVLVVDRGDQKAPTMPEIRVVEGMLAAGWGGAGTLQRSEARVESRSFLSREVEVGVARYLMDFQRADRFDAQDMDISASENAPFALTLQQLRELAIPEEVLRFLDVLAVQHGEEPVVRAFWAVLLQRPGIFPQARAMRRSARMAGVQAANPALVKEISGWLDRQKEAIP